MQEKTDVVIVDDHKLFRKGIRALLEEFSFIGEVYEAGNGIELLELLKRANPLPGIILLDIQMPVMDGIEAHKKIQKLYPQIKVIIITMDDDEQFIIHMISQGVNGYLLKNTDPEELEKALQKLQKNDFYFPDDMARLILQSARQRKDTWHKLPEFTEREMEVLELICKEHTAPEIAVKLGLNPRTIENYRTKLLEKTDTKNIAGLVVYAIKNKLVFLY
jgi:DNA-binding NarL/FixJ family response regulator